MENAKYSMGNGKYGMENGLRRTAHALQKEVPKLNEGTICGFIKNIKERKYKKKDECMLVY